MNTRAMVASDIKWDGKIDVSKEMRDLHFQQWAQHDFTKMFVADLQSEYDKHITAATNMVESGEDLRIRLALTKAKTLREVIEYVTRTKQNG